MTQSPGKDIDRASLSQVLADVHRHYKDGESWLGHGRGGRGKRCAHLDELLLQGATEAALKAVRQTWKDHVFHLMDTHGLLVESIRNEQNVPIFRFARDQVALPAGLYPDELSDNTIGIEGLAIQISVNAYERDGKARQACIDHYGMNCWVCDINFGKNYGPDFHGLIHVHHIMPLNERGGIAYTVDPVKDLVPVCPNCHAMLHFSSDININIHKLREIMGKQLKHHGEPPQV
ncbi:HNH endonuclease [Chitinimonas viridis]|uniref:HNH endonuclease n=1 Tax=Chitinimonas viridis TaxID=664880 RepID=A0ABT8B504_9NEIS|nr:HNH endonuclease [Chitinimonas viridis]MDN3577080.1 HNH endonuclease [Chitinimonas viridis]